MIKFLPYIAAAILAVGAYFTGGSVEQATGILLDKNKALQACHNMINGSADAMLVKEGEIAQPIETVTE